MQKIRERWKRADLLFTICVLILPVIQFCIFYIGVNFNSIVLAFQKTTDGANFTWAGFDNFATAFNDIFKSDYLGEILENTFTMYFISQIVMMLLCMFFAFMFWKKVYAYKFFSVVLFLPSIISGVVFTMVFRNMTLYMIPELFKNPDLVTILNPFTTGFSVTLAFTCFLSFGANLILLMGAMSGTDQSVVEYGKLDGVNVWQEFAHIVFPHIWPTIISLFMIGLAGLFSNMGYLLTFYGDSADAKVLTIGYYIYLTVSLENDYVQYPYLSALGLILSVTMIIVSFILKYLLEKYGPSED